MKPRREAAYLLAGLAFVSVLTVGQVGRLDGISLASVREPRPSPVQIATRPILGIAAAFALPGLTLTPEPTKAAPSKPPATPKPSATPKPTPTPKPSWAGDHAPYQESGYVNGYPCGGKLPTCKILNCESHGDPKAENPRSSASGLWQVIDGTWNHYGGYHHASDAPPSVQNDKAVELWSGGSGESHWRACA